MDIQYIEVGKCYDRFKLHEGVSFYYEPTGLSTYITMADPTEKEIQAIRNGKFSMGFFDMEGISPYVVCQYEGLNKMDCPLIINEDSLEDLEQTKEELIEGKGLGLNILLANNRTGKVEVMRLLALPSHFSGKLLELLGKCGVTVVEDSVPHAMRLQKNYSTYQLWEMCKKKGFAFVDK